MIKPDGSKYLTTPARKLKKRIWRRNNINIASWNIISWGGREQDILNELNNFKIDFCALSETKKKGNGTTKFGNYVLAYSGKKKEERASAGVGLMIHEKFSNNIEEIEYVNERIILVTLKFPNATWYLLSVYAPDISKTKEQRESFYEDLHNIISQIPQHSLLFLMGDLNARVGNKIIPNIKQRFNENVTNENGDLLINLCAMNSLRINNTFFEHKNGHKITWANSRGQESTIDYIITNRNVHPSQVLDVRAFRTADIGSDHRLLIAKVRLSTQLKKRPKPLVVTKFNMESFQHESVKELYTRRVNEKLKNVLISKEESIDQQWGKIKTSILSAGEEALGLRTVNLNGKKKATPWYTPEIKYLAQEKRKAYMNYLATPSQNNRDNYVTTRNVVNSKIRKIKEEYWEAFTAGMENDLYGAQKKVWKLLRRSKNETNEFMTNSKITIQEWEQFFRSLYQTPNNDTPVIQFADDDINISREDVTQELRSLKNRKAAGPDNISNEMLKYGGLELATNLTKLFQNVLTKHVIPNDWKASVTIPVFKKGSKSDPENYRGITLMNSTTKLFTKLILNQLLKHISPREEQQGFRKNRSTTDAIFIVRQIVEKAIEFNKPAYLCFVDLTKAFDRVRLQDVIKCLKERAVPSGAIKIIQELNSNNSTIIRSSSETSKPINISGIRQGDSLSPMLFNILMDKIIDHIPKHLGYKMGETPIPIVCYADDAVLMAENEEDLQALLDAFDTTSARLNMKISTTKTKSMVIAKTPLTCNIQINNNPIEQLSRINYLGVEISSKRDVREEVKSQVVKGARISGCLYSLIWRNKYLSPEGKLRIYKTSVRPVITYGAESRADTTLTKQLLRTTEMRIIRTIHGKTIRDRVRSEDLRDQSGIKDIVDWVGVRRKGWADHVERMSANRIPKIVHDNRPQGTRSRGRPKKRWHQSFDTD